MCVKLTVLTYLHDELSSDHKIETDVYIPTAYSR